MSDEETLTASIWSTVSKIIEEEIRTKNIKVTPQFEAGLAQLVFDQIVDLDEDLAAFASHAGRQTVVPADMLMVVRKNPQLSELLSSSNEEE